MISTTYLILRTVGSPFSDLRSEPSMESSSRLFYYAIKNRIPLLFLEALNDLDNLGSLKKEYNELCNRYGETVKAISRVSQLLKKANVDYALFKSIRPYSEVTVDIDTLIFNAYQRTIWAMRKANYSFLNAGHLSATFCDIKAKINVDLYNEISASHIIYLDKNKLRSFIMDVRIPNGDVVRSLNPVAELLAIIAHSVIKEQMYVLSEYYTTLNFLLKMNSAELEAFLDLANSCKLRSSVATHLGITAFLHLSTYEFVPNRLKLLINEVGFNAREVSRVARNGLLMPYKYHPLTITEALIEKLEDSKARRSFALQAIYMFNPSFGLSVIRGVLQHMIRESY